MVIRTAVSRSDTISSFFHILSYTVTIRQGDPAFFHGTNNGNRKILQIPSAWQNSHFVHHIIAFQESTGTSSPRSLFKSVLSA